MAFTQKGNLKTHVKRAHHAEMVQSMKLVKASPAMLGSPALMSTEEAESMLQTSESTIDLEGVVKELFPERGGAGVVKELFPERGGAGVVTGVVKELFPERGGVVKDIFQETSGVKEIFPMQEWILTCVQQLIWRS